MTDQPDRLADKALSAVHLPGRAAKPRQDGLTIVADRGLGRHAQQDLLELAADYIDIAKLAMGLARLLDVEVLHSKLERYNQHGIPTFFAGEISELAIVQGA